MVEACFCGTVDTVGDSVSLFYGSLDVSFSLALVLSSASCLASSETLIYASCQRE